VRGEGGGDVTLSRAVSSLTPDPCYENGENDVRVAFQGESNESIGCNPNLLTMETDLAHDDGIDCADYGGGLSWCG